MQALAIEAGPARSSHLARRAACGALVALCALPAARGASPLPGAGQAWHDAALASIQTWVRSHDGPGAPARVDLDLDLAAVDLSIVPVRVSAQALPTLARPASRMALRMEAIAGDSVRSWVVPAHVSVWRQAWVARRDLRAGADLQGYVRASADGNDPAIQRAEVDIAAVGAWPWDGEPRSMRLRTPVLAGHVLEAKNLMPVHAVMRGDVVVLRSRVGGVQIDAPALAGTDADIGQSLPVRMVAAGAAVTARVIEPGIVEVGP